MSNVAHMEKETAREDDAQNQTIDDPDAISWDDDSKNPLNWTAGRRWAILCLVSAIAFIPPFASSIIAPPIDMIMADLHSSNAALATLVVSIFMLGFACGPLVGSPLSELYGRAVVLNTANLLHMIFTIACALSSNVNMLIGFRFLAGCVGSAPITIGGGMITDMMPQETRGKAMAIFISGPVAGPALAPVIGGFVAQAAGWRWDLWLLTIVLGIMTVFSLIFLKETHAPTLLKRKAANADKHLEPHQNRGGSEAALPLRVVLARAIVRPSKMLILSPIVLALSCYMATVYGYLYLLFTTFPTVFQKQYHFTVGTVGLTYLGLGVGMVAGLIIVYFTSDQSMLRHAAKSGRGIPEHRLPMMIYSSPLLAAGLLWYGWSADKKTHWMVPILGTMPIGTGIILVFNPLSTYLLDAYPEYSASAIAASTILRSTFSAFLPLVGPTMYAKLGLGWGNSLLAFIALAFGGVPMLLYRYGETWRENAELQL